MTKMYNRQPAAIARHEADRATILGMLEHRTPITYLDIERETHRSKDYLKLLLFDMLQCGDIVKEGRGQFVLPDK